MLRPVIPVLALRDHHPLGRGARCAGCDLLAPPDRRSERRSAERRHRENEYTLKRGDTFASALTALGVPNNGAVVSAAMAVHDVAKVRAGDT